LERTSIERRHVPIRRRFERPDPGPALNPAPLTNINVNAGKYRHFDHLSGGTFGNEKETLHAYDHFCGNHCADGLRCGAGGGGDEI
jgi:hypothetical protein